MTKTLERDPSWIEHAPIHFQHRSEIQATAGDVWSEIAADETWVSWFPGFRACRFTTQAPHGEGSLRFVHQDQFKVAERITVWEPNQRWAMTVVEMNLPVVAAMAEELELQESDGRTIISWRVGVQLTKLARPLRRPLEKKASSGLQEALRRLGERVELQAAPA